MSNVIFHIDMNAYFASVSKSIRCDLDHSCVAVSHTVADNGIIMSACYEARKYGVCATMSNKEARNICPGLIIVETNFEAYKSYTKKIFDIIRTFSPLIEPASIDECYVDVTNTIKKFKRPLDLAMLIQNKILNETGIPCSIGIASNKFLAKMASDLKKPMGITVIRKSELEDKLWPLPIQEMFGIGEKSAKKLISNGILTIKDLIEEKNYQKVKSLLGNQGEVLILNAKGFDQTPLSFSQTMQSISQSKTYTNDLINEESMITELKMMLQKITLKAKEKNIVGKHISIVIRYSNGKSIIRSTTLLQYTDDFSVLWEHVLLLFEKHYDELPVKLLGVGLGSIIDKKNHNLQQTIFECDIEYDVKEILNKQLKSGKLMYLGELNDGTQ